MALNFPDSPTLNQVYTDSNSGFSYKWNGSVWISNTATETVIKDGSITPVKLSTGGPSWNVSSDVFISGIATATGFVGNLTGTASTATAAATAYGISGTPDVTFGTVTAVNFVTASDENLKQNIQTIDHALEKLTSIRGVSFEWKKDEKPSMGVIAQEIEEVFPSLVITNEYKAVNYDGIIGVLIEAVKELQEKVHKLENDK